MQKWLKSTFIHLESISLIITVFWRLGQTVTEWLHKWHPVRNIRALNSRRMRRSGQVECMKRWEINKECLLQNSECESPIGRHGYRRKGNVRLKKQGIFFKHVNLDLTGSVLGPVTGCRKHLEWNFASRNEGGISRLTEWLLSSNKFVPFDLPVWRR